MTAGGLADCDPLAVILTALNTHATPVALLGGEGRASGYNRPPYPCVRVLDGPGGSDRTMNWLIAPAYDLAVFGDLDGLPGKPELRRITYGLLEFLATMPEVAAGINDPVITQVLSLSGGGWLPEPNGQPKYVSTIQVFAHPPRVLAG